MSFVQRFREIVKPVMWATGSLFTFTGFFVLIYITFDYQFYLSHHKSTQTSETIAIQEKHVSTFEALKKLMELACVRIQAARNDTDRLTVVLNSLHNLSSLHHLDIPHGMIDFQKVTYIKLIEPHSVVSRFGAVSSSEIPEEETIETIRQIGSTFAIEDNALKAYMGVKDGDDLGDPRFSMAGILEIQINRDAYLKFLGNYQTVAFVPDTSRNFQNSPPSPILENPIPIFEKYPQSFSSYIIAHKSHYAIFAFFALIVLLFVTRYLNRANKSLKVIYRDRLDNLEVNVAQLTTSRENLTHSLTKLQEDTKAHKDSCQAKKNFLFDINVRRKLQEHNLNDTLIRAVREVKNPKTDLSYYDYEYVLSYCLKESTALFKEHWDKNSKIYELFLDEVIESVQVLFADRIHSKNVKVTVDFPEEDNDPFDGDPLFAELILMQILGQAIYSVPADGYVFIQVRKIEDAFEMKMHHNGFSITDHIEELFKKNFDLFINNAMLQHMCKECNIVCTYTKICSGDNVTHVKIPLKAPKSQQEIIKGESNVVPLFQ